MAPLHICLLLGKTPGWFWFSAVCFILVAVVVFRHFFSNTTENNKIGQSDEGNIVSLTNARKSRSKKKAANKFDDMAGVEEVMDATFQQNVLESSKHYPVLVDFYASWCGPCRALAPMLERIAQQPEYKGRIRFIKMDVDRNRITASSYHIRSMPTLILFEFGSERQRLNGVQPPAILAMLNRSLGR